MKEKFEETLVKVVKTEAMDLWKSYQNGVL